MTHPFRKRRGAVFGASTIATVALTTSLVSVSTANAAGTPRDANEQQVGPLVTQTSPFGDSAGFSAPTAAGAGNEIPANRAGTLTEARAKAVQWFIPAARATTPVRPASDPDLCLQAGTTSISNPNSSPVTLERCVDGEPKQQFRLAANTGSNNPIGTGLQSTYNDAFLGLYNTDDVMRLQSQTVADRIATIDDFVTAFSAQVDRVDVLTRTAHLSGVGTPGSTIWFNGGSSVPVDGNGTWSKALDGLAFGRNTITVEQYDGGTRTGSTTVTADLTVRELAFETSFAADRDAPVNARGTAHPGASVALFDADGNQLGAPVPADPVTGAWSTTIPAPNAGGDHRITASQLFAGLRDTAHDLTRTVSYGAAVAITTPADGSRHTSGPVEMTGTGETGSAIDVYEVSGGTQRLIGSASDGVRPNRQWAVTTEALDRGEHLLRVVQKSRGANTTVAEITLNPGESGALAPITLASPDTVTPGVENVFTGTGEPGAAFEVLNPNDTEIGPSGLTMAADGSWTFTRVVSTGATKLEFKIRQHKDGLTSESEVFTLRANEGFAPVVVRTPTLRPGERNTFTGTGPANASYRVLNASNNELVPGTFTIDGAGQWQFERNVSKGALHLDFKLEVTIADDGPTYRTKLFRVQANTR